MLIYIYKKLLSIPFLIGCMVSAVILYNGYKWEIADIITQIMFAKQQEENIKTEIAVLFQQQLTLEENVQSLATLKTNLDGWQKKLINNANIEELIHQIVKIGVSNKLQFRLVQPGEKILEENYNNLPLKIIIKGTYNEIANFISQVANLPWIVVIDNFKITNNKLYELQQKQGERGIMQPEKPLIAEIIFGIYTRAK